MMLLAEWLRNNVKLLILFDALDCECRSLVLHITINSCDNLPYLHMLHHFVEIVRIGNNTKTVVPILAYVTVWGVLRSCVAGIGCSVMV